jgi:hypothetical protein
MDPLYEVNTQFTDLFFTVDTVYVFRNQFCRSRHVEAESHSACSCYYTGPGYTADQMKFPPG